MLVVTTTVRVVHGVHSHTTSTRPGVPLDAVLVVCTTGLEQGLVDTSTTGDDSNSGSGSRRDSLLGARGQTDSGHLGVGVVSDDGSVVARGSGKSSSVTSLLLDVANDGTLGQRGQRENVADVEGGLLSTVDELASVCALSGNECLDTELVAVRVAEGDAGEGCTSTGGVRGE